MLTERTIPLAGVRSGRWVCVAAALLFVFSASAAWSAMTESEFRARVEEATRGLKDLTMVATVVQKDKKAMEKVDPSYVALYEFKSANLLFRYPAKLRMEGKLGMVNFEYIINDGIKIFRAPKMRINKRSNYSHDPAKLQHAFDLGVVTPCLWKYRRVEVLDDPEAEACGEIKLRLHWPKGDSVYLAWVDAEHLWLKRYEKRDGENNLQVRTVYSNPQHAGGVIWVPTRMEVCAPDGQKAGVSEMSDIKVNVGLAESLFE